MDRVAAEVSSALAAGKPVVALETAVLTHGLPAPYNLDTVFAQATVVRGQGTLPAIVGLLHGKLIVGLNDAEIRELAASPAPNKINLQNLAVHRHQFDSGGTTVAATMFAACEAGIKVVATGGIGGVHRGNGNDVSADLPALASTRMILVCSGPKAILDIPATLERLETDSVPVLAYRTDDVPAFFSTSSGCRPTARIDDPEEAAAVFMSHPLNSSILVCQPPPVEVAIPNEEVEQAVNKAEQQAKEEGIKGRDLTPFLLANLEQHLGGRNLAVNTALLIENARLAAQIAIALAKG